MTTHLWSGDRGRTLLSGVCPWVLYTYDQSFKLVQLIRCVCLFGRAVSIFKCCFQDICIILAVFKPYCDPKNWHPSWSYVKKIPRSNNKQTKNNNKSITQSSKSKGFLFQYSSPDSLSLQAAKWSRKLASILGYEKEIAHTQSAIVSIIDRSPPYSSSRLSLKWIIQFNSKLLSIQAVRNVVCM